MPNVAASPPFHSRLRVLATRLRPLPALAVVICLAIGLSACKVVVTVPAGGKVVTEDGFVCLAGESCVVDVSDEHFDSTFTAVPDQGYTFARWQRKPSAFCADSNAPCYLTTTTFNGHEGLAGILASDQEFFLEPVFVHYSVSYWKQVLAEIESGGFSSNDFLYAINPVVGNCDPGALSNAAQERALQALNQTRALHELPAVDHDSFYDMQTQEASLVQRANNYLSHSPASSDDCYTAGARDGAGTSNLSRSSQPRDPASNIFGWNNDNFNVAALMEAGHRRWILYPQLGYMSYGQVQGYAALKVFGFNMPPANPVPADLEFVAMPYRDYPYNLVSKGSNPTPWSFSMVPPTGVSSAYDYFSSAQVAVSERHSGRTLAVQNLHSDNKGYGLANFLSWMVDGWDYDITYTVSISNIRMPGGGTRDIEYPVMLDRYHLFEVNYPLEATDARRSPTLRSGSFNSPVDKDSYRLSLAGHVTVTGDSEYYNQAFFIMVYDQNKQLVASSDRAFSQNFAQGQYTLVVSPCDEDGLCYLGTKTYSVTNN